MSLKSGLGAPLTFYFDSHFKILAKHRVDLVYKPIAFFQPCFITIFDGHRRQIAVHCSTQNFEAIANQICIQFKFLEGQNFGNGKENEQPSLFLPTLAQEEQDGIIITKRGPKDCQRVCLRRLVQKQHSCSVETTLQFGRLRTNT